MDDPAVGLVAGTRPHASGVSWEATVEAVLASCRAALGQPADSPRRVG